MKCFEACAKAFAFLVLFFIYAVALFGFALDAAGAGHGTAILFVPLMTSVLLIPAGVMAAVGEKLRLLRQLRLLQQKQAK